MNNYNQGLLDAYEACQGVRESGCESAQGASECCTAIRDLINSTPPVLAAPANSAVLPELPPVPKTVHCVRNGFGQIDFMAYTPEEMQEYARTYGQACAAAARSAPNAELVAALKAMVADFDGCYADAEPAMIKARAALAAVGEAP